MMKRLTIESVGMLATLQDLGRHGFAHLGVGQSGAADRASYRLANRLVGNAAGAACIETTFGQLTFSVDATTLIAVTGAAAPVSRNGRRYALNTAFTVRAGDRVSLGVPTAGLRSYVAIRGGLNGTRVLGSMAWDTMAQIGTPPLSPGTVVGIGGYSSGWPATDLAPVTPVGMTSMRLPLRLGPRDDWFSAEVPTLLATSCFTVTPDTDRIGARLDGPHLPRQRDGELASEGVVIGALQVPTRGRPTLFLADRPVTGGYPVVGVVPEPYVNQVAQAVPGTRIQFVPISGP